MPTGIYKRTKKYKLSEKTKKKMSKSRKGKKFSEEHKKRISKSLKGKKRSLEFKIKLSIRNLGNTYGKSNKGRKLSEKWRKKISKTKTGSKHSEETIRKMSLSHGGTGVPIRTRKRYYHLRDKKYMEWRSKVFERDNWTCQTCNKRGVELQPHHIKGWTKYPELRYVVENGVSLCIKCHRLTYKKH